MGCDSKRSLTGKPRWRSCSWREINPDDRPSCIIGSIFFNPALPHLLRCNVLTAAFRDHK